MRNLRHPVCDWPASCMAIPGDQISSGLAQTQWTKCSGNACAGRRHASDRICIAIIQIVKPDPVLCLSQITAFAWSIALLADLACACSHQTHLQVIDNACPNLISSAVGGLNRATTATGMIKLVVPPTICARINITASDVRPRSAPGLEYLVSGSGRSVLSIIALIATPARAVRAPVPGHAQFICPCHTHFQLGLVVVAWVQVM